MNDEFDVTKSDSQGTVVQPLAAKDFPINQYAEYEESLKEKCLSFQAGDNGVAVYRRFRVPEVFSWGCRDRQMSLEWQLAALNKSMTFDADIPNFLEPWYGIGVLSSPFGVPYLWEDDQAPAVQSPYSSAKEALEHLEGPVEQSIAGKEILERIEYFLNETKGRIPVSLTDTQSPLNAVSSYILNPTAFIYETFDNPEDIQELMKAVAKLEKDFIQAQMNLIGDCLAKPGHGFASSRFFKGLGFSDDNILMFSDEDYRRMAIPALCDAASVLEGPVFHSCGDWSPRSDLIKSIPGLIMADGAVGHQTDPSPNNPDDLGETFAGTGITLHVRIVGDSQVVKESVARLWKKDLKLIVATYCETESDQRDAYDLIHRICH